MASTPDNNSIRYRPEIDGLRALAVVPVLFYHYHLGMPGGFVGVDVFFVISGYLISSLLFKSMQAPPLNLLEFWERRIRRVFPALAVVTFSTLVVGWFLLLPADYKELGESVLAQTLLSSNVFFWRHTGYFDSAADIKPLLHTWSLAVEEQFYLLYPLVLLGATKLRRPVGAWILLVVCLASFGMSVDGVAHHPQAAFYLLPSRIWELGLGALVATFAQATPYPHWIREAASAIGLAMILCAIFFYNASTPFPDRCIVTVHWRSTIHFIKRIEANHLGQLPLLATVRFHRSSILFPIPLALAHSGFSELLGPESAGSFNPRWASLSLLLARRNILEIC